MAEIRIDKSIIKSIESFVAKLKEYYAIDAVYLFGSFAKGNQHKDSDIDLAIVSSDVQNRIIDGGKIWALTWNFDTRIEPHVYNTKDFGDDPLVDEILKTGIKVA